MENKLSQYGLKELKRVERDGNNKAWDGVMIDGRKVEIGVQKPHNHTIILVIISENDLLHDAIETFYVQQGVIVTQKVMLDIIGVWLRSQDCTLLLHTHQINDALAELHTKISELFADAIDKIGEAIQEIVQRKNQS